MFTALCSHPRTTSTPVIGHDGGTTTRNAPNHSHYKKQSQHDN